VTDNVAKYKALPTFTAPGDPIDPSTLRGKSMFLIPLVPNPFNQNIQETMEGIAKKVGMNFTIYPNQGTPSEWVQGMNAALTAKPDIIVLSTAPDPRTLQPQLEQAKAAGIPVLVTHFYDDSSPVPPACEGCAAGVTALVTAPFNVAGTAAADWIIADSKGNANVLLIGGADVLPSPGTLDTISKEFAAQCSACKVTVKNIPVSDWNTKAQSEVQSALTADPSINYVYPLYDAMVAGAVPAVQTLGKTGQVKVVSYNGSPYALKYIQDGDIVAMNVGEDTVGIGYASMDQAFRILLGKPTVDERTPIRIWDKTNVNEAGTPPAVGKGYGSALSDGFLKLWGLPAAS
jgi:ribose transport system substrate-binding protein